MAIDIVTLAMAKKGLNEAKESGGIGYSIIKRESVDVASLDLFDSDIQQQIIGFEDFPEDINIDLYTSIYQDIGNYNIRINLDGISYEGFPVITDINKYFGNFHLVNDDAEDTHEPFCIMFEGYQIVYAIKNSILHRLQIEFLINDEYLQLLDFGVSNDMSGRLWCGVNECLDDIDMDTPITINIDGNDIFNGIVDDLNNAWAWYNAPYRYYEESSVAYDGFLMMPLQQNNESYTYKSIKITNDNTEEIIFENSNVLCLDYTDKNSNNTSITLDLNKEYTIVLDDGTKWDNCKLFYYDDWDEWVIGNDPNLNGLEPFYIEIWEWNETDTTITFNVGDGDDAGAIILAPVNINSLQIIGENIEEEIHPIAPKYLKKTINDDGTMTQDDLIKLDDGFYTTLNPIIIDSYYHDEDNEDYFSFELCGNFEVMKTAPDGSEGIMTDNASVCRWKTEDNNIYWEFLYSLVSDIRLQMNGWEEHYNAEDIFELLRIEDAFYRRCLIVEVTDYAGQRFIMTPVSLMYNANGSGISLGCLCVAGNSSGETYHYQCLVDLMN